MNANVLLIEDSESNRITLGALLEAEAFHVVEAASLGEAKGLLSQSRLFDIVLLDRQLGDGLGTELIPLIRATMPSAKVILTTGVETRDLEAAAPRADGYFSKGADLEELLVQMQNLLAQNRAR